MPCDVTCGECHFLPQCGGEVDNSQDRECGESCAHFDNINQCCWQSGEWGLCLEVSEGDLCHLGYKIEEKDDR